MEAKEHFKDLSEMNVPVKRAAYSDRTAWTMAILAELAYTPFDEEVKSDPTRFAKELAEISTADKDKQKLATEIEDRIKKFLKTACAKNSSENEQLKAALEAGGFTLAGDAPIHEPSTDTQAYVAIREPQDEDPGMAVIVFRGTTNIRDWMRNVDIRAEPVEDPKPGKQGTVGHFHKGFHDGYRSVEDEINKRLAGTGNMPLYITGHSLGGALAVVATWYQSAQRLAACYTFGAPRVGDHGLMGRFKTPIYRIVNAADPVPYVPPSGVALNSCKAFLRLLENVFPFAGIVHWLLDKTIRIQPFRHYGDIRYLPFAEPGPDASYGDLQPYCGVSGVERVLRYFRVIAVPAHSDKSGARDRVDRYHEMKRYRDKLRAIAKNRNS